MFVTADLPYQKYMTRVLEIQWNERATCTVAAKEQAATRRTKAERKGANVGLGGRFEESRLDEARVTRTGFLST